MTVAYPLHFRSVLASKSRNQPAAFRMVEPRRGYGYAQASGTDVPVFWDVTFRFQSSEAVAFQLWLTQSIAKGVTEFTMFLRTEFGYLEHVCRFLPDSLLPANLAAGIYTYTATIMARAQVIPQEYLDAADLIVNLPDWSGWAGLLDRTMNVEMPEA